MTRQQRQELAGMGPDRLESERSRWAELKMSVEAVRTHPLLPELERIGAQAATLWQRNAMLMNMPDAGEQISRNWEQMGELYQQAMELRARMLGTRLQSTFGLAPGSDPREDIMDRLNTSFSVPEGTNSSMRAINRTLSTYARGLTADPSAVLDGSARDAHFYRRNRNGRLMVDWNRMEAAYRNIDMIAASPASAINPEQRQLLQQMRSGIGQMEAIDPVGAAIADWRRSVPVRQTDYRPIRFLTGVGASFITGIGLIMGAKHGFTWPTALWAGIAALSINPSLARSNTYNAVRRLSYLNEPQIQNVIQHSGLSGDRGAAAIEELHELGRGENRSQLNALIRGNQPITMAQIGQLTDGRNTPLVEAMARLGSDEERKLFLQSFLQSRSRDEQQITREYIRGRNQVDMRLDRNPFLFGDNATA